MTSFLGPHCLSLSSNTLTISSPLLITLTLSCPPPTTTIYAISISIRQITTLTSSLHPSKTEKIKGPKLVILREGATQGWSDEGFARRARARGETIWEGGRRRERVKEEPAAGGKEWVWQKVGRLPSDDDLRPTTMVGTKSDLRHACELCVEVVFNESGEGISDESVKVVTMFLKSVDVAS
jgi:hypothetical protein